MKKVLFLLVLTISFLSVNAQYKPYVSGGTSLYKDVYSYGGEFGVYDKNNWVSIGLNKSNSDYYGQLRCYRRLFSSGIIENYVFCGFNIQLSEFLPTSIEPGFVYVFNISKKWAPMVSLSIPINEDYTNINPFSCGIGINYYIK